jgi:uncharacterized LabA/DUF88 family protein
VFIDFWNFQLNWNERVRPHHCDWRKLPTALVSEAADIVLQMGDVEKLTLEETIVYASVDPVTEKPLKHWLANTVDRMPSYKVKVRERRPRPKTIHCRHCHAEFDRCSTCGERYMPRTEKGVDTAIVTDLLSFAFQESYDLDVIVSGDADFIPAIEYLQSRGLRIVNAGWSGHGHDLKRACWAAFDVDAIAATICRTDAPA